jgi:hypothetical protein
VATVEQLVAELRRFSNRREIIKSISKGVRRPVPEVRKAIRRHAVATLPSGGGLGRWVAAARINVAVKLTGYKSVGIKLKGGRNSAGGRAHLTAIDEGRVRAPSWGRRGQGQWHSQSVTPGFFTVPASGAEQWRRAVDDAVDGTLDQLRGR